MANDNVPPIIPGFDEPTDRLSPSILDVYGELLDMLSTFRNIFISNIYAKDSTDPYVVVHAASTTAGQIVQAFHIVDSEFHWRISVSESGPGHVRMVFRWL